MTEFRHATLKMHGTLCYECVSMVTLISAHGGAILINHGPSEFVAERIIVKKSLLYKVFPNPQNTVLWLRAKKPPEE